MSNHPHCEECSPNFTCQECLADEWAMANNKLAHALAMSISIEAGHAEAIDRNKSDSIARSAERLRLEKRFSSAPATD